MENKICNFTLAPNYFQWHIFTLPLSYNALLLFTLSRTQQTHIATLHQITLSREHSKHTTLIFQFFHSLIHTILILDLDRLQRRTHTILIANNTLPLYLQIPRIALIDRRSSPSIHAGDAVESSPGYAQLTASCKGKSM